jgi:hypothetical protein
VIYQFERRELATRSASGMEVSLAWEPDTNDVVVICYLPEGGIVQVRPRAEDAMLAFHHPFAYNAFRTMVWNLPDGEQPQGDGRAAPHADLEWRGHVCRLRTLR